ncbi:MULTISPECIES: cation:proton antiporter [Moorena]|uniref:NhaP-type antiporter n=1 Tax=Moorena producens 3L TaxID=489825 RepID=F4XS46_9CYAN|nr:MULTISPECIES: cation:proton antiporter [Moorena]NEQ12607.1 sodium:proton antiporter [Moorena sp. SIO3E2]EGJ32568.1 NhaP-type antiporter [Moorena producens 3L]NEP31892.1 sodium:proton antiporter [Moorena sp. SIO3B2]NEP67078.1 sodium:proton antiporter [Moorena sp. SIO3A5]NEQ07349.1 sodium:proton antiporter [Moorena sp. SIO4E2]
MESSFELTLQMVIAIFAGISAQVMGEYLKIPSIVFLLMFGTLLGPDGFGLLHPQKLGVGLEVIVALSVAVILFEGGLNLDLRDLGKVSGSLRNLVTIGTLITLLGGGMAAHWLGEFPWPIAFLYASLVVVTGPTVISPLLKQVKVDRRVETLLEGEGVLIDPVGAILAVVVLDTILNSDAGANAAFVGLGLRLSIGAVIGGLGGWLMGFLLKQARFISEELKNLVVLAGMWGLFGLAQMVRSESGLMATVVAGVVLGASDLPEERLLRRFKGQLTVLGVSMLFVLLSADLSIASVFALGWGSIFTVLVLMLVVRPISVVVCTWNSDLNWRQKLFVSWIGPKGIVSASVASLFAILLTERGVNGGDSIKALVFLTIMLTVVLQGLTARWVAKWLKLNPEEEATGAVIIGCNPMSRLIARLFQERGESVVLIDTDPEACQKARDENLRVFQSSGLDVDVLEEAGIESVGTFLAMTKNGEINLVLAQRAVEEFNPPRVLAVFPRDPQVNSNNNKTKVNQAFMPQLPIKTWIQYINDGQIKLGKTTLKEAGFGFQRAHLQALIRSGELVPLLVEREKSFQVASGNEDLQAGDNIIYLLHDPRPKLLKRLSGGTSSSRLALEKLPKVEELPISTGASNSTVDESVN